MRTFVIGDIHGAFKAFINCLEQAVFNYEKDRLICLGDVCDRGPEVNKVFDELLKIKNLVYILGNHDLWAIEWAESGILPDVWLFQGGSDTVNSYTDGMPETHLEFLKKAHHYYLDKNKLFVHGGIHTGVPIEEQDKEFFLWDRSLVSEAMYRKSRDDISPVTGFDEIFVGHTPTHNFGSTSPIKACEVWLMDTGAGWGGLLSLMNVDTKEIFQSEVTESFYA